LAVSFAGKEVLKVKVGVSCRFVGAASGPDGGSHAPGSRVQFPRPRAEGKGTLGDVEVQYSRTALRSGSLARPLYGGARS
jgi:hypothetical protein